MANLTQPVSDRASLCSGPVQLKGHAFPKKTPKYKTLRLLNVIHFKNISPFLIWLHLHAFHLWKEILNFKTLSRYEQKTSKDIQRPSSPPSPPPNLLETLNYLHFL